jgi:SAM-dependent methyltransferase
MQRVTSCTAIAACLLTVAAASWASADEKKVPDCVYVGTPNDVVEKMIDMAKIKKTDLVYDPGCGDGRMVIMAAKKHGCRGIGYEIVPKLLAEGNKLAKRRKVDHLVKIEDKDIFKADYSDGNVVLMYLLPEMIVRMTPQFEKMKDGSRIVAHDYPIKGVAPDDTVTMTSNEDNVKHTVYLYTLPLKKERKKEAE